MLKPVLVTTVTAISRLPVPAAQVAAVRATARSAGPPVRTASTGPVPGRRSVI
ncbi:hypothetical protein ACBI99_43780 [Nonomuraea sp. ATR24]|uniref:hypothetical protein n=1 Tax=Nonomuraea sp. ATR24 TaxID=1676744 RepID=UPI0035C13488